jgi:hypothetical protein
MDLHAAYGSLVWSSCSLARAGMSPSGNHSVVVDALDALREYW